MPDISALIAVLIVERPLCVDCIAEKAGASVETVRVYIELIETTLTVKRGVDDRCRSCGNIGKTFALARRD